jgi:hypothetical protein
MDGIIIAVNRSPEYTFSKPNEAGIRLLAGLGVDGDVHSGEKVKHRSRVRQNPDQPNLRQVHLIHAELHDELRTQGFDVSAGRMGENITTRGIDLLHLPKGTRLHLGKEAVVEVTGLRNPCEQLDRYQDGLLKACVAKDAEGNIIRKAGIMSIVLVGGEVFPNDPIRMEVPPEPHEELQVV